MKNITKKLIIITIMILPCAAIMAQVSEALVIGQLTGIRSEILDMDRNIQVQLPDSYKSGHSSYPVLLVMDGERTFHPVSGIIKLMSWQGLIPEMIVVGIPNINREKDFMPAIDSIPVSGGADRYISFFREELFPFLDSTYRTDDFRIIYGHSYLGLFCLYTLKNHPGLFNAYISGSPALNFYEQELLSSPVYSPVSERNTFLYIATGGKETERLLSNHRGISTNLSENNNKSLVWKSELLAGNSHDSNALTAFIEGIKFIYPDWEDQKRIIVQGPGPVEDHFKRMSERYGYTISVPERIYRMLGAFQHR